MVQTPASEGRKRKRRRISGRREGREKVQYIQLDESTSPQPPLLSLPLKSKRKCCFFFFFRIRKRTIGKLAKSLTKQSIEEMQQIRAGGALRPGRERGAAGGAQPRAALRSPAQGRQRTAGGAQTRNTLSLLYFSPTETHPPAPGTGPRIPSISRGCGRPIRFISIAAAERRAGAGGEGGGRAHTSRPSRGLPGRQKHRHQAIAPQNELKGSALAPPRRDRSSLPTGWDEQDGETSESRAGISSKTAFRARGAEQGEVFLFYFGPLGLLEFFFFSATAPSFPKFSTILPFLSLFTPFRNDGLCPLIRTERLPLLLLLT